MMKVHDRPWQVAVIGGGIAGAVAAIHASRSGLRTILLEKETDAHDKVCGEFVSPEAVELLEEVGIDFAKLGAASIESLGFHGPVNSAFIPLPLVARAISHAALDSELLRLAAASGVRVHRGVFVQDLIEGPPLHLVTEEGPIFTERVVLATGKTEFRAMGLRPGRDEGFIALETHVRLRPDMLRKLNRKVELFIFKHGYAGLLPVEEALANFCCLVEQSELGKIGSDWDSLATHIARHNRAASFYLENAEPVQRRFTTVGRVPFGFLRSQRPIPGVYSVGDQMAVVASMVGDGIAIAAMTGKEAVRALIDPRTKILAPARTATGYQRRMRRYLKPQIDFSFWLHRLFKSHLACEGVTYVLNAVPALAVYAFFKTRTWPGGHSRLVSFPRAMLVSLGRSKGDGSHAGR